MNHSWNTATKSISKNEKWMNRLLTPDQETTHHATSSTYDSLSWKSTANNAQKFVVLASNEKWLDSSSLETAPAAPTPVCRPRILLLWYLVYRIQIGGNENEIGLGKTRLWNARTQKWPFRRGRPKRHGPSRRNFEWTPGDVSVGALPAPRAGTEFIQQPNPDDYQDGKHRCRGWLEKIILRSSRPPIRPRRS